MNLMEKSQAKDGMAVNPLIGLMDSAKWKPRWKIEKFANDEAVKNNTPYEVSEFLGNQLMNAGINAMLTLLAGGGGTAFNNANAYLGVGDSTDAEDPADTNLQAATNKVRVGMNVSFPTYGTGQEIEFQSDFDGDTANFDWNEFGTFNHASAGTMLNRKVSDQGTKTAGQTWRLTMTITVS